MSVEATIETPVEDNGIQTVTQELIRLEPHQLNYIKKNPANRVIDGKNSSKMNELIESFKKYGFNKCHAIIVGSDMVIKAGHYRFTAAKIANVPIYVVVSNEYTFDEETEMDDVLTKWTTGDYVLRFSRLGIESYVELNKIVQSYPNFPIKIIVASAVGIANQANGSIFKAVRRGNFNFRKGMDRNAAEHELDEIQELHDLMLDKNRKPQDKIYMHIGLAYLWLKSQPNFNKNHFFKNVSRNKSDLVNQSGGTPANREMLKAIYNKGLSRNKIG